MKPTPSQRRLFVMVMAAWVLITLVRQVNHAASPLNLSLWVGGLLVAFPAIHLNPRTAFTSCFIIGLMLDAWSPLPFGTHALLFGAAQIIIGRLRMRLATREPTIELIVALIANLILFVAMTFIVIGRSGGGSFSGFRLLAELAVSQVVIALILPWYFALQSRGCDLLLNFRPNKIESTI
ncbi:MAG: hypothetical protein SynsKO_19270 [Synoicihabitans sp.]